MIARERRYRLLSIAPDALLTLLHDWRLARLIQLPVLNLPADAEVCDITYSWQAKSFEVVVWHPSFPEVPDGAPVPWHGPLEYEVVEFARPEPDQPVFVDLGRRP